MADYTWVDLQIPEAILLSDLSGVLLDLQRARQFAEMLAVQLAAEKPNWEIVEPLSIAATVAYSRPFTGGVRTHLAEEDLEILSPEQRAAHDYLRAYRDKHVAHSVNAFEQNDVRAYYCIERVQDEGITSIGLGSRRITGLSHGDVESIIKLTTVFETHVQSKIRMEEVRLLSIVQSKPLKDVLDCGRQVWPDDLRSKVKEKRKLVSRRAAKSRKTGR